MSEGADEAALIERVLAGDERAFALLVDRYERIVFNVALRMVGNREDAKDVAQAVFVKAYQHLRTFDRHNRLFSWLYRIAIHECLNARRGAARHVPLDERLADTAPSPEERAARSEVAGRIQMALLRLNDLNREVIVLRHFACLSHQEMSDALKIPIKTVKSRLHTARVQLAKVLEKQGVEQV